MSSRKSSALTRSALPDPIDARASQRPHICALQTGSRSPIPACHANPSHAVSKKCPASSADGPNTFQTKGRAVDGGLAQLDADRGCRRPRGDARTECVSDHGTALGPRPPDAVPVDPLVSRLRGAADVAPVPACDAQSHSLHGATRLVLRVDPDSPGTG